MFSECRLRIGSVRGLPRSSAQSRKMQWQGNQVYHPEGESGVSWNLIYRDQTQRLSDGILLEEVPELCRVGSALIHAEFKGPHATWQSIYSSPVDSPKCPQQLLLSYSSVHDFLLYVPRSSCTGLLSVPRTCHAVLPCQSLPLRMSVPSLERSP